MAMFNPTWSPQQLPSIPDVLESHPDNTYDGSRLAEGVGDSPTQHYAV